MTILSLCVLLAVSMVAFKDGFLHAQNQMRLDLGDAIHIYIKALVINTRFELMALQEITHTVLARNTL
jgi:hypothetical protein